MKPITAQAKDLLNTIREARYLTGIAEDPEVTAEQRLAELKDWMAEAEMRALTLSRLLDEMEG